MTEDRPSGGIGDKPRPADGSPRDEGVDGLRGLAALFVLVYHVITTPGGAVSAWMVPAGDFAVAMFFGISGYLLWRPVARRFLAGQPMLDLRSFALRRFARIAPAYWVAITAGFWVLTSGRPHSVGETVYQYTLTQIYRQGDKSAGLFVAWTLTCEIAYYVLVAVLVFLLGRFVRRTEPAFRTALMLGIIAGLGLIAVASRQIIASSGPSGSWRVQWPPNLVDWFAFGMLVAVVRARGEVGIAVPNWLRVTLRYPWLWVFIGADLYWVLTRISASIANGGKITPLTIQAIYALVGIAATTLLVPVVLGPHDRGPAALLSRAPFAFLGRISYGMYLWHAVWLPVINRWSRDGAVPKAFLPRLLITLALTLPSAWVSWELIERPCIAWAVRRSTTLRSRVPAAGNG